MTQGIGGSIKSWTMSAVWIVVAIVMGLLLIVLAGLFFTGAVDVYANYLSGILGYVSDLAFALTIVFLFLCIFRKCRVFAGTALVFCSYAIAINIWFVSLIITYAIFGIGGVILGVVFFGVGVYVTGLVALLWAHLFGNFVLNAIALGLMFGIRYAGVHISGKELERRASEQILQQQVV